MSNVYELPVIFRKDASGEVTAVFPTEPFDMAGTELRVYAHVGQHGGASFGWYHGSRKACSREYKALLRELRGIYESDGDCRLIVCERMSAAHKAKFAAAVRRIQG